MSGITGLNEFRRKLEDMSRRAKDLSGTQSVPIPNLLTPEFLRRCSRFHSADEMFAASGFQVESPGDFEAIPDAEWDEFIRSNTAYPSWEAMMGEAVQDWTAKQLGFNH